jgi:hypothetical protein
MKNQIGSLLPSALLDMIHAIWPILSNNVMGYAFNSRRYGLYEGMVNLEVQVMHVEILIDDNCKIFFDCTMGEPWLKNLEIIIL